MCIARQTLPYYPFPKYSNSIQFSTILPMTVNLSFYSKNIYKSQSKSLMYQLYVLIVLLALIEYVASQENVPTQSSDLKYYVFSSQCFDTFFVNHDWFNVQCLKKTIVKLLGYGVVLGAAIVKVPQIIKIIKNKSTFGVSFPSVLLQSFTQLSAVAYNVSRGNPFSVYGQTLLIAIQCIVIHFLFIYYGDKKSSDHYKYLITLVISFGLFYAAINPEYFPRYVIQNAMIIQIVLFTGARLSQIYEVHRVKSTGSLSEITCGLTFLGNLSRLATALVEVADDHLYKLSVFIALALNGYILLSFLIFKNPTKVEKKQ